jgi:hypothetical protein
MCRTKWTGFPFFGNDRAIALAWLGFDAAPPHGADQLIRCACRAGSTALWRVGVQGEVRGDKHSMRPDHYATKRKRFGMGDSKD